MTATTCVIYNPAAGRGRAEKQLKQLPASLLKGVELRPSQHAAHATELARSAVQEGFKRVVAAGGDGTVHEVANGMLQAGDHRAILGVWPIGSANDYAYTLGMTEWWRRRDENWPLEVLDVDVGLVSTPGSQRYVIGCMGVGFNGMVTIEARRCHWLSGMPLYGWAFLKAMVNHFATPTMSIRFDDQDVVLPTLALSILNAQREGNFPLRPAARLTDGTFDYMHATRLSRGHLLRFLPGMATGRLPENQPLLRLGRARQILVRSQSPLCVHADGEFVCVPGDDVREVLVEVVRCALRVEVYREAMYGITHLISKEVLRDEKGSAK